MNFIPANKLTPDMILARDIICNNGSHILKKGVRLTNEYITYLIGKGYMGAYVENPGSEDILVEESVSRETILNGIQAVEEQDIKGMIRSAHEIVYELTRRESISVDIMDLRSYDDYTYHHSVNVAIYSVAVGQYLGMPEDKLIHLCEAGLYHDLGKQRIPIDIINKPGRLSDEEFKEIKNHPKYSFDILFNEPEVPASVRQAVLCHHENENGSGYPNGLEGSQIPIMGKILHAVDVFDALISRRPYKKPYTSVEAFEYMTGGKDILFDKTVVEAMKKVIPAYPIATEVRLSNGKNAVVVEHTGDPLRPIVKIVELYLYLDLSAEKNKDLFIESGGTYNINDSRAVQNLNEDRMKIREKPVEIMIVDDSAVSLQGTGKILTEAGYKVISLQSGMAALNYLKEKKPPDLILMDVDMPKMSGIQTVSNMRKHGFPDLPVIFLTAMSDKDTVVNCISVKAKDYIIKPALPTYLLTRVAIALNASLER